MSSFRTKKKKGKTIRYPIKSGSNSNPHGQYSFNKLKNDPNSFYNDPKMLGHKWAIETVDSIESLLNKVVKTNRQKAVASVLFDFNETEWQYFSNITKKDIKQHSYILRRLDKEAPLTLLVWKNRNSSMLKDRSTHILEYLSYKDDFNKYATYYSKPYIFMGLTKDEAKKWFHDYHKKLERYDYIKQINDNYI